jgi:hypothetical protein
MKSCRWTSVLGLAYLVAACAADTTTGLGGEDIADEDLVNSSPVAAGIVAGSIEEQSVLNLVNDATMDVAGYRTKANLSPNVASAIVGFRDGPTKSPTDDKVFDNLAQVDALPLTGKTVFDALLRYAKAAGYDFAKPNMALFEIPDNLGRPPTSQDVGVVKGFDGRSPAAVEVIVRRNLTNAIHPQNERFVTDTIRQSHKAFTVGLGNFFVAGSPGAKFLRAQSSGAIVTLLGTASSLNPSILEVDRNGGKTYFVTSQGGYVPVQTNLLTATGIRYPILMRGTIRETPAGIRLTYPKWSATVLLTPTSTIVEGG